MSDAPDRDSRSLFGAAALIAGYAALHALLTPPRKPESRAPFGAGESRGEGGEVQNLRAVEQGRGRQAHWPWHFPLAAWKNILWRTYRQIQDDRLLAISAGVVFYALLALFPTVTALVSLYGLFAQYRMFLMQEALLPGMHAMQPKFDLTWTELEPGVPTDVAGLTVTAHSVRHTWQTNPTALRVEAGGKVVAYTGDGEFSDEMAKVSQGADLLVAECYFHEKPVKWHLNYPQLVAHKKDFGAKRIILTHMSKEMLAVAGQIPEECAHDGLVVEI
jgi:hypothetical protein